MNNPKGTIRFVALFHEELVEASQALHALSEHGDGPRRRELLTSALTACAAALWHAKDMGGDDASFVIVRRPMPRRVPCSWRYRNDPDPRVRPRLQEPASREAKGDPVSDRRLLIAVKCVKPDDSSMTRFAPHFEASAMISRGIDDGLHGAGEDNVAAQNAIDKALSALSLRCIKTAPNGRLCHHPISCTLAGSCLKQRGGGTACNE